MFKDVVNLIQEAYFAKESTECKSSSIILKDRKQRNIFLNEINAQNIMTRPIWTLMNKLPMFECAQHSDLENSEWLEECVVNIPNSAYL
jgi:dTDP-4-amino-4,6-dideoxygalactose transaminase